MTRSASCNLWANFWQTIRKKFPASLLIVLEACSHAFSYCKQPSEPFVSPYLCAMVTACDVQPCCERASTFKTLTLYPRRTVGVCRAVSVLFLEMTSADRACQHMQLQQRILRASVATTALQKRMRLTTCFTLFLFLGRTSDVDAERESQQVRLETQAKLTCCKVKSPPAISVKSVVRQRWVAMARVLDFSISFEPEFIASSLARIWKLESGKFVRRRDVHNHAVDTCPISLEPMQDPVLMSDGHIYEKDSILQWLASGNKCSPCTRAELTHKWVLRLLPYIQTTELLLSSQGDATPTQAQSVSCPDSISAVKLHAAKCAEALETCINSPRDLGRSLLSAQPLFTELEEMSARLLSSLDQLREAAKQESQAVTDAAVHRIQRWVRHNMAIRRRKKQAAQLAELCSNALLKGKIELVAKCFDRTDIDYRQVVANLREQRHTLRQEMDSHLTPLQKAARAGLVHAARLLLRAGLTRDDINLFVSDLAGEDDVAFSNSTCLHLAVHPNHVNMTRFLCQELADVDRPCTSINVTALVLAARFDHCEIIEELVRARADMEKATKDFGCTPLFEAVGQGKVAAVESLCKLRAQINRTQTVGFTPLFLSARIQLLSCCVPPVQFTIRDVQGLSSAVGATDPTSFCPARTGVEEVTSTLIRLRANLEKADVNSGFTPLCEAARRGHAEVIRILCMAGAEKDAVTKSGFSPLLLAASNNRIESLKALCDAGVDKDKLYRLKIWDAAPGDLEIGSTEHTILSCILGEAAVRRKMKESKGKQHITVWDSGSTLFASAFQNQPEIVQALCEKKADMDRPTSETQLTALFIAAVRGHEEVVRTLIHASADVRRRAGKTQITPATAAARAGRGKVASLLAELADEEDFAESSDKRLEVHTLEDVIRRTEVPWSPCSQCFSGARHSATSSVEFPHKLVGVARSRLHCMELIECQPPEVMNLGHFQSTGELPPSGLPRGLLESESTPTVFNGLHDLPEHLRRSVFQARREAYSHTSR